MSTRQITLRIHHQDTVDWLDSDATLADRYEEEVARRMAAALHATVTIEDGYLVGRSGCGVAYDSLVDDGVMQEAQDAYEAICEELTQDWSWTNPAPPATPTPTTGAAKHYPYLSISGDGGHQTSAGPSGMAYAAGQGLHLFYQRGSGWYWCVSGVSDSGLAYEGDDHGPFSSYAAAKHDALTTLAGTIRDFIATQLSRRDCQRWHAGRLTRTTQRLTWQFGPFQVWGIADPQSSEEPLSVVYPA